jgi:hypothetical protein
LIGLKLGIKTIAAVHAHHKHNLPHHLDDLTIRVAINRNAEALHDAANLAK